MGDRQLLLPAFLHARVNGVLLHNLPVSLELNYTAFQRQLARKLGTKVGVSALALHRDTVYKLVPVDHWWIELMPFGSNLGRSTRRR